MRKEMRGTTWMALIPLLAAAGSAGAAPAAKPAKPAKPAANTQAWMCEMGVRSSTYGLVDTSKLWMKGSSLRWEKRSGAGLRIMLIRNSKGVYQINQASNDGHKWPRDWERDLPAQVNLVGGPQGDPRAFLKGVRAKRTGTETYEGRQCDIWSYAAVTGNKRAPKQIFRVWVAKPNFQPMKVETRQPTSRGGFNTVVIDYKTYRWGLNLPDSFFAPPRGSKIVDLGKIDDSTLRARPASMKTGTGR
jgi:outer membrane lipoprotein-sorting protein